MLVPTTAAPALPLVPPWEREMLLHQRKRDQWEPEVPVPPLLEQLLQEGWLGGSESEGQERDGDCQRCCGCFLLNPHHLLCTSWREERGE